MVDKVALISVFSKEKIVDLAKKLSSSGYHVVSSGGTASILQDSGVKITEVADLTGFPEMLDGRVKTLHPRIHAGILARRDIHDHMQTLQKHKITPIDIVVCNLYPFEETIQKSNVTFEEIIENIDIGGPTLIRAAAKNCTDVLVVTHPRQYQEVIKCVSSKEGFSKEMKERFALEAFSHTAQYDTLIAQYLRTRWNEGSLPSEFSVTMRKIQDMRYGENPHQKGAFYKSLPSTLEPCISNAHQFHGKELSFNNILDSDCAIECIKEFSDPTCVIIKHATPCGIASHSSLLQAWKDAYATDENSPFGGIVAFNREVTEDVAKDLSSYFLEVIIAPKFSSNAAKIFKKKKNLRLLLLSGLDTTIQRKGLDVRSVVGGFLIQDRDTFLNPRENWEIVTTSQPTPEELDTMEFAVKSVKHVKSNSVLFAKGFRTVAIGGGQTSRIDAAWIASHKGKEKIKGSVMASDAFFPFRDAVDVAAKAGVKAIIQPGGSIRDSEVIKAANEFNISMVFSKQRYFRH